MVASQTGREAQAPSMVPELHAPFVLPVNSHHALKGREHSSWPSPATRQAAPRSHGADAGVCAAQGNNFSYACTAQNSYIQDLCPTAGAAGAPSGSAASPLLPMGTGSASAGGASGASGAPGAPGAPAGQATPLFPGAPRTWPAYQEGICSWELSAAWVKFWR